MEDNRISSVKMKVISSLSPIMLENRFDKFTEESSIAVDKVESSTIINPETGTIRYTTFITYRQIDRSL